MKLHEATLNSLYVEGKPPRPNHYTLEYNQLGGSRFQFRAWAPGDEITFVRENGREVTVPFRNREVHEGWSKVYFENDELGIQIEICDSGDDVESRSEED